MRKKYRVKVDDYVCPVKDDFKVGDVLVDIDGNKLFLMMRKDDLAVLMAWVDGRQTEIQAIGFPDCCHITRKATRSESNLFREEIRAKDFYYDVDKCKILRRPYLTDEQTQELINCLVCKHCYPPRERVGGKMCGQERCTFDPA